MSGEQCGACDVDLAAQCSCGVELVTLSLCQQCHQWFLDRSQPRLLVLSRRRSFMSSCRAKPCQACILLVVVCVCVCSCVCHSSRNPINQFCCPVLVSLTPAPRATCCTPMAHNVLCTIGFLRKAGGRRAVGGFMRQGGWRAVSTSRFASSDR